MKTKHKLAEVEASVHLALEQLETIQRRIAKVEDRTRTFDDDLYAKLTHQYHDEAPHTDIASASRNQEKLPWWHFWS